MPELPEVETVRRGIARLLRGWATATLENVALWHERDITHSSVERIAVPDACLALDFALARMNRILQGLTVDADRMRANLDASQGTVFSQAVLLALISSGTERDAAYRIDAADHRVAGGWQRMLSEGPRTAAVRRPLPDCRSGRERRCRIGS